jgi:hypothetical protein
MAFKCFLTGVWYLLRLNSDEVDSVFRISWAGGVLRWRSTGEGAKSARVASASGF